MKKINLPSIKHDTVKQCMSIIAVTALIALIAAYLFIPGALATKSSDTTQANAVDAQTAKINISVSNGKQVAAHPQYWNSQVKLLSSMFPSTIDDQSLTQAVINAGSASGVSGPSETRKAPVAGPAGLQVLGMTITGVGPQSGSLSPASLISFASQLQLQPRLISLDAITFNFGQSTMSSTGSSYFSTQQAPKAIKK